MEKSKAELYLNSAMLQLSNYGWNERINDFDNGFIMLGYDDMTESCGAICFTREHASADIDKNIWKVSIKLSVYVQTLCSEEVRLIYEIASLLHNMPMKRSKSEFLECDYDTIEEYDQTLSDLLSDSQ